MSEHVFVFGPCWSCKQPFAFNPDLVPSIPIDPETNLPSDLGGDAARVVKQPVCADCIAKANAKREAAGRPLLVVKPGAYVSR